MEKQGEINDCITGKNAGGNRHPLLNLADFGSKSRVLLRFVTGKLEEGKHPCIVMFCTKIDITLFV